MYKTLWNGMNKQMGKSLASALFLAVLLIGWTAAGYSSVEARTSVSVKPANSASGPA